MKKQFRVARTGEIPVGKGHAVEVNNRMIAIFNVDGQFHAIDDMCPHMGASLAAGELDGCVVSCPLHGWRYDVTDGTWRDNPRVSTDAFPVTLKQGEIFVEMEIKDEDSAGEQS